MSTLFSRPTEHMNTEISLRTGYMYHWKLTNDKLSRVCQQQSAAHSASLMKNMMHSNLEGQCYLTTMEDTSCFLLITLAETKVAFRSSPLVGT